MFENYQRVVHKEDPSDISQPGFKRFLCTGLGQKVEVHNGRERRIGSYHQCYRLDGRLIAMGVLDLLPHCVSSVYLMYGIENSKDFHTISDEARYHEDFNEWDFGKLSAMREITLAIEENYRFYYMGSQFPAPHVYSLLKSDSLRVLHPLVYQDAI